MSLPPERRRLHCMLSSLSFHTKMHRTYKENVRLVNGHTDGITAVAFSPKGDLLATAGMDGKVCFWRVQGGKLLHCHSGNCPVLSVIWLPTADYSVMCGTKEGNIIRLTITSGLNDFALNGFWAHDYPIECLAASGDRVASGAHSELKIWKWNSGDCTYTCETELEEPQSTLHNEHQEVLVTSLHWTQSPQHGPLLIVTYMFHGLYLFETTGWTRVHTTPLHGKIASASVSEDGKHVAISNIDTGFDIYVLASGAPLCSFEHDVGDPRAVPVSFIHGGRAIVGGSVMGKVNVWDIVLRKRIHVLSIPARAKVLALAAHYVAGASSTEYKFYIATGVYNEGDDSACILWKADVIDAPDVERKTAPRVGFNAVLRRLFYLVLIMILVAVLLIFIPPLDFADICEFSQRLMQSADVVAGLVDDDSMNVTRSSDNVVAREL